MVFANVSASIGQIDDTFGASTLQDQWIGDRDKFTITDDQRLQLNAPEAGSASLFAPYQLTDSVVWEVDIHMDFNPSNSNALRLYLYHEDPSSADANRLYLKIGTTGNLDALELYQYINGSDELIATGTLATLAQKPDISLISKYDKDGILSVSLFGEQIGCLFDDIYTYIDPSYFNTSGFFGWICSFTSTRRDKFFFDNVHVGKRSSDTIAPRVRSIRSTGDTLTLEFSEAIIQTLSITIQPDISFSEVLVLKDKAQIIGMIAASQSYQLSLSNFEDLSGNIGDTTINYTTGRQPDVGDLLINEILFNPKGEGADYIEIINTTSLPISLTEVSLLNNTKGNPIPLTIDQINANAILLFTTDIQNITTSYPFHNIDAMHQQTLPKWNNGDGNASILWRGNVIDALDYDEDMHLSILDDVDGVSLERIDINQPTQDRDNWTSGAGSVYYGTPGVSNSTVSLASATTFVLSEPIFSPNNDGLSDELKIDYELERPGYIATLSIYTDRGRLIHELMRNQTLSTQGTITWDGRDKSGNIAPIGLYILLIDLFDLSGGRYRQKLTFGIADYLD